MMMMRVCLYCKYIVGSTFLLLLQRLEFSVEGGEEPHHKMAGRRIVIISMLLSVE